MSDKLEYLLVSRDSIDPTVVIVTLNRPKKLNSMNVGMLSELHRVFSVDLVCDLSTVRVVIIVGSGDRAFTSGLDLMDAKVGEILNPSIVTSPGDRSVALKRTIDCMQLPILAIANFPRPVIAYINGACIGLGVDIASACDIRICSSSAVFGVKEIKIGICADLGSLFFLPRICKSDSWVREICYSGRNWLASEALQQGFVSQIGASALELARNIAQNPPIATEGIKVHLNHSIRNRLAECFDLVSVWNSIRLQETQVIAECVGKVLAKMPSKLYINCLVCLCVPHERCECVYMFFSIA